MGTALLGIALGILLGLAVIVLFLFLGSRNTIDEPSLSGGATDETQSAKPARSPAKAPHRVLDHAIRDAHRE